MSEDEPIQEGDTVWLRAQVFRADSAQALVVIRTMHEPTFQYSVRVPIGELKK